MNLHRHCGLLLSPLSFLKIFLHLLSDFTTDLEAIRPWIYTVGVKNCYVTIGTENYFMNLYVYLSVNKVLDRYQNADALLKGNETKNVFNKCSSLNDCRPRLLKIKTVFKRNLVFVFLMHLIWSSLTKNKLNHMYFYVSLPCLLLGMFTFILVLICL